MLNIVKVNYENKHPSLKQQNNARFFSLSLSICFIFFFLQTMNDSHDFRLNDLIGAMDEAAMCVEIMV